MARPHPYTHLPGGSPEAALQEFHSHLDAHGCRGAERGCSEEMVREVLDPSPREEVHPQRAGGTWQPGPGARVARSLQSRQHQKTPQDVMMRSRSWELKVGAQGGGPTFPLRPRLESRALWERHPSTGPLRPPCKRLLLTKQDPVSRPAGGSQPRKTRLDAAAHKSHHASLVPRQAGRMRGGAQRLGEIWAQRIGRQASCRERESIKKRGCFLPSGMKIRDNVLGVRQLKSRA